MNEEEQKVELKNRLLGIGAEVGGGVGTDFLTAGLLNPLTLAKTGGLSALAYGAINFGQGAYTNYLVQKYLHGKDNVNWGEVIASGGMGAIPFMELRAGKLAGIVGSKNTVKRGLIGGGLTSLAGEQTRVGIDEQRFLNPIEAATAIGVGGTLGGGLTALQGKVSANRAQQAFKKGQLEMPAIPDEQSAAAALELKNKLTAKMTTKRLSREFGIVKTKEEALYKFWKGYEKGNYNRFYTLLDTGEQIMIDIKSDPLAYLKPNAGKLQISDFAVVPYRTANRYSLKNIAQAHTRYGKIPPEVQSYIHQVYGLPTLKRYKKYIGNKRSYNQAIKKELIEELENVKLKIQDAFTEAKGVHESHFTAVGANLTNAGYVARNFIARKRLPSKLFGGKNPKILRNPPKDSGLYNPPNVDQLFLEYAKANISRQNNPAIDIDSLRELGIPTDWLESINTFLLQDNASNLLQDFLIRQQITNYDLKDLVEGRLTADQIISKRLQSHFEDLYKTSPLDEYIARITSNPKLTAEQKSQQVENILKAFGNLSLTKGMMDNPSTLGGGTAKGGPVKITKPKKDK
tara:strand:+ start:620 stop:2335 length:1716 start_codon:yes stop_codon:yes gene_type:complete